MKPASKSVELNRIGDGIRKVLDPHRSKYCVLVNVVPLFDQKSDDEVEALYFMNGPTELLHAQILDILCALHGRAMTKARMNRIAKVLLELEDAADASPTGALN